MAEVLGVASSIVALIDCAEKITKYAYDVIKAKEERERLFEGLQSLQYIVERLDDRCKDAQAGIPWYKGLLELVRTSGRLTKDGEFVANQGTKPAGALAQLYKTMAKMLLELNPSTPPSKLKKARQRLAYHWDKDRFEEMLKDIAKSRGEIDSILDQDEFELSRSIKEDSTATRAEVTDMFQFLKTSKFDEQDKVRRKEEEEERAAIEQWLSPLEFLAKQEKFYDNSFKTGQWLLDDVAFKHWIIGQPWHLRCYGQAGSGKTILSSIMINHLQERFKHKNVAVICLYLDYKDSMKQTKDNLYGSLLKQLLQVRRSSSVSAELKESYEKAKRIKAEPRLEEVRKLLRAEVESYERVYLVVDALDECYFRQQLITELRKVRPENLSLLATSRRLDDELRADEVNCDNNPDHKNIRVYVRCTICDPDGWDMCLPCSIRPNPCTDKGHKPTEPYNMVELEIRTPDEEIEGYVKWNISKEVGECGSEVWDERRYSSQPDSTTFARKLLKDPGLLNRVPSVIVEKADGRMLYAKLYMDSLKSKKNLRQIQETLDHFPDDINDLYDEAIQRIKDQKNADAGALGLMTLSRIVCAHRALSFAELQHVLTIESEDTDFDPYKEYDKEDILSSTFGLITIDSDKNAVRPVHFTLQEYLDRPDARKRWFPDVELEMANACMTYLNFEAFSKPCQDDEEFEAKREKYPFVAYASQYWGDHVRDAGSDSDLQDTAARLIEDSRRVAAFIQAAWYTDRGSAVSWDVRKGIEGLHVCAWFGMSTVIPALDQEDLEVDVEETTHGQTPLMYACRKGHVEVVRELLKLGASVNKVSGRGRTALFEAIAENRDEVVELLLSRDELEINAVQIKESNRTGLMLAARLERTSIVTLLLDHPKIKINQQDTYGCTALFLATVKDLSNIVEWLVQKPGIDVDLVENWTGRSPLILAAERDNCEIINLLLQNKANPNLKDRQSEGTAMLRAAESGSLAAIELMLSYNVDLGSVDEDGRGLVHGASANGWPKIIRLLEQHGLNLNSKDSNGMTPLHEASRNNQEKVTEVLLELGADPTIKDKFERTPLKVAWQYGNKNIMSILQIEDEIAQRRPTQIPEDEDLPVWSLAKLGLSSLIQKTITTGKSDISETEPGTQNTAFHWAVRAGHIDILELLLQSDPSPPNHKNRHLRTPLHLAAVYGNLPATSQLLLHNADPNLPDRWSTTPLYIAQSNKHFHVAMALIEAPNNNAAVLSAPELDIQKLFFAAVELGNVNVVNILLQHKADVTAHNEEGLTALQMAKAADDADMIQALRSSKSFFHPRGSSGASGSQAFVPFRSRPVVL